MGGVRPRIFLLGFGGVGRTLARRLLETGPTRAPVWNIVAVADSRGVLYDEGGVDLAEALRVKETTASLGPAGARAWDAREALARVMPDIVVEATLSDPLRGEPGTGQVLQALRGGADVVTCNKGPLAVRYAEVEQALRASGRRLRYGTTVGGIVPILETLVEHLPAAEITGVDAVLNTSTQFVLHRLGCGLSFPQAWEEARRLGYTEPDPRRDQEGWDAAMKAAILHNLLFGRPIAPVDVRREPLTPDSEARALRAIQNGGRLVSLTRVRSGQASVELTEVDADSHWVLPGGVNRFCIETRRAGTLSLEGRGAGPEETASGLLADLLTLLRGSGPSSASPPIGERYSLPLPAWTPAGAVG